MSKIFLISESQHNEFPIVIEEDREYGNYYGVIHNNIQFIKNWFLNRKIDFEKYKQHIKLPVAFLNNINIYDEYRGLGYGNELYEEFEDKCHSYDASIIILESDNDEQQKEGFNLDAWYKSFSFEEIGKEGNNTIFKKFLQ
jgi:GNAT superfamily N-acetyltransferase